MGRRKKNKDENGDSDKVEQSKPKWNIAGDAKRSAVAVFLFALSVLITLGFFGSSGMAGEFLNGVMGKLIGWAKFIFPLFLALSGIILLLRHEKSFYATKLAGLSIVLLSIVGFSHWFYDSEEKLKMAQRGLGGGYVGYGIDYLLEKILGSAGAMVVMVSLFFIGIIVAFNFSFVAFFQRWKKKEEITPEAGIIPNENQESHTEQTLASEAPEEKEVDPENNIGKIEFVEGADQYISQDLMERSSGIDSGHAKEFSRKEIGERRKISRKNRWNLPPLDLLEQSSGTAKGGDTEKNAEIIQKTLHNFGIEVEKGEIKTGPAVTQYSFRPAVGVKISKILSLQNDLSLALAAHPIRIEAPIPGKSLIGIEVPNKVSAIVRLRGIMESSEFKFRKANLMLALGEDVSGNFMFGDLSKMPHLLIAGATGTGKSVCINSIITALLYQNSPQDLKFIMVDPKRVELSLYNGIPHLLTGVVVENGKVINALRWAVGEMERRYRLLQDAGSRDIASYQEKVKSRTKKKYKDPETGEAIETDLENLPYIVIIIDELADLMGSHGKEVEGAVVRLAQMARAVGIHLIISTQRPSVEVITGLIKANITTRIAFQVATQIDSRTILDMGGAEKLLGNGDLLYLSAASPKPKRIQGVFVSESEVKRVVSFIKDQNAEDEGIGEDITSSGKEGVMEFSDTVSSDNGDELLEAAKTEVIRAKKASASLLQRRLRVGYARAARLIDILEEQGVVGPADGAKPREVYAAAEGPEEISYEEPVEDQVKRDKWQI